MDEKNVKNKEKAFSSINIKSFVLVTVILVAILFAVGVITNFIPQGAFQYNENGEIIPGTYAQGQVQGIAFWRVLTAPVRVFFGPDALTIIMISLFLLIMSGVFNVMEKTDGVKAIINKTVKKFSGRKLLVVCILVFFFMAFGSFFGMFEELVTLLPLAIVFMLSMGYDTLTGVGVCMLSACFGFSSAITNPFSVGLAFQYAKEPILSGVWLRIIFFVLVYAIVCTFLILHIKKIKAHPEKSLTFSVDLEKRKTIDFDAQNIDGQDKIFKTYAVFFCVQLVILILIAGVREIADYAIPILAVSFLVGGLICGCLVYKSKTQVFKWFGKGALAMLPSVFLIALASSVKFVLNESNVTDTVMNYAITVLQGKSKFVAILLIYLLILFLQIFIGSASAKIMLIMPIILPVCQTIGISPALVILTYCMADGFTDMVMPTNPMLLIGLSMANVSYGKWIRWTWLLQLIVFALTILILLFGVAIGYGL